jgi:hypothetical protein
MSNTIIYAVVAIVAGLVAVNYLAPGLLQEIPGMYYGVASAMRDSFAAMLPFG